MSVSLFETIVGEGGFTLLPFHMSAIFRIHTTTISCSPTCNKPAAQAADADPPLLKLHQ